MSFHEFSAAWSRDGDELIISRKRIGGWLDTDYWEYGVQPKNLEANWNVVWRGAVTVDNRELIECFVEIPEKNELCKQRISVGLQGQLVSYPCQIVDKGEHDEHRYEDAKRKFTLTWPR